VDNQLNELIIDARGVRQVFKVSKREKTGLFSSLKSLFAPEFIHVEALTGIDFPVAKGEIRGLIGPNGAGKSTMIKILSGVLYPTAGEVRVMGYTPWLEREDYLRNIGVVFGQKTQLWWDLPPIDTFSLNQKMYRIPKTLFRENLEYFKDLLNISEVITRPTRQLSLGERMKCDLVCAMLHEPKVVFLDEPTIGLDLLSKETIREFIKQTNRQKQICFILTTHDMADIEDLCEKITVINKGAIVYNGMLQDMKTIISGKKIVEIKFSKPVSKAMLSGFQVADFNPMSVVIEILPEQTAIQTELAKIMASLPVQDININDIGIEEVIKQLYRGY
jgi:ABC-2 type transport system ATP-binding protein